VLIEAAGFSPRVSDLQHLGSLGAQRDRRVHPQDTAFRHEAPGEGLTFSVPFRTLTRPSGDLPRGRAELSKLRKLFARAPLLVLAGTGGVAPRAGVVAHRESFGEHSVRVSVSDHPVRSFKGGFAAFL
jgi:hypothetical protein